MFQMEPGVFGLMASAASHQERPKGHRTVADGDLGQMSAQLQALREGGFEVKRWDVYATVPESDYRRALEYLWHRRTDGWWNLPLVTERITTEEERKVALDRECDKR